MIRAARAWLRRLGGALAGGRRDRDFSEEMESHLRLHTEDNVRRGMTPEEGRRRAILDLGGVDQTMERYRDRRGVPALERLGQDLKTGFRVLRKNPGYAALAITTLALGIGANTAIFSVVSAVLLRPLPYDEPERLVQVWHTPPREQFPGVSRFSLSPANLLDWRARSRSFEHVAAYDGAVLSWNDGSRPEALNAARVAPDLLAVLRARPEIGRTFLPEEETPGKERVVLLGHRLWRTRFGSDEAIVGRTLRLGGAPYTVVGVMPQTFRFPAWAELWIPLAWTPEERAVRGIHDYRALARLAPGVSLQRAQADLDAVARGLETEYPADNKGWGALLVPLHEQMVGEVRPALWILFGAVCLVLLIACANVANLVLARTLQRRKEIALRAALGASRGRILQQVLAENVVLALAAALLGLLLAPIGIGTVVMLLGDAMPGAVDVTPDLRVLGFTLLVSIVTGLAAGLLPGWRMTRVDPGEALKQGMGKTSAESGGRRTRGALVVAEVSISLVLLVAAGLMVRTLSRLRAVDPGFDPRGVVTMTLALPDAKYPTPESRLAFFDRTLERVRALPGIAGAGAIDGLPMVGGSTQPVVVDTAADMPMAEQPEVAVRVVSSGYRDAMRIPLLRGRDLGASDAADRARVVAVSESFARRFWPDADPIGRRLTLTFSAGDGPREVVGVFGDVKQEGLAAVLPAPTIYVPMTQAPRPYMFLAVRPSAPLASTATDVAAAVAQVDAEQPVTDVMTLEALLEDSLAHQRTTMLLLSTFAGFALVLAAIGIYSVLSYAVRRRVPEIGLRVALGARRFDVLWMIVGQGLRLTLVGLLLGGVGALGATRLLGGLLYGVRPADPPTFAAVCGLLLAIALLACWAPARRATRVDPMIALRQE
jgi:putative ABC transport system permease protein